MKTMTDALIKRIIALSDTHFVEFFKNYPNGIVIEERTQKNYEDDGVVDEGEQIVLRPVRESFIKS